MNQAGGNGALALILTVSTNMIGIFTVPWILKAALTVADVSLDSIKLLTKLCLTLLVPLIIGKGIQALPHVMDWVTRWKVPPSCECV